MIYEAFADILQILVMELNHLAHKCLQRPAWQHVIHLIYTSTAPWSIASARVSQAQIQGLNSGSIYTRNVEVNSE
jgi:hypothetical protein